MLQTAPAAPAADTTIALYNTTAAQAVTVQSESPTEAA